MALTHTVTSIWVFSLECKNRDLIKAVLINNITLVPLIVTHPNNVGPWSISTMMTSSNEKFPRYWPLVRGIHRSPVNSTHKGQWRGALVFPLTCARIHGWVNNREAGDLRRHRGNYDVTVMTNPLFPESYMHSLEKRLWFGNVNEQTDFLLFSGDGRAHELSDPCPLRRCVSGGFGWGNATLLENKYVLEAR